MTRVLTLAILVAAVGCAAKPIPPATETGGGSGSEFGAEGGTGDEGLGDRGATRTRELEGSLRSVYFDYDASELTPGAQQDLRHNADVLMANPELAVRIEGNCDERGSDEYNLALGKRRAEAAMRFLVDLGIDGSRIGTVSYGEENPAESGSNEAAWARNRRDDFKLR